VGRDNAISLYVNMSLSCSGMSVLSGYGMCTTTTSHGRIKSQSKIHLNPEKRSIYKGIRETCGKPPFVITNYVEKKKNDTVNLFFT